MAAEIGPGTLLICVDASEGYRVQSGCGPALARGALYRVAQIEFSTIHKCHRDNCGVYIILEGKDRRSRYCRNRFKPLIDGDGVILEEEIKEPEHA